jgi:hypothetical protein
MHLGYRGSFPGKQSPPKAPLQFDCPGEVLRKKKRLGWIWRWLGTGIGGLLVQGKIVAIKARDPEEEQHYDAQLSDLTKARSSLY